MDRLSGSEVDPDGESLSFRVAPKPPRSIDPSKLDDDLGTVGGCASIALLLVGLWFILAGYLFPYDGDAGMLKSVGPTCAALGVTALSILRVSRRKRLSRLAEAMARNASLKQAEDAEAKTSRLR